MAITKTVQEIIDRVRFRWDYTNSSGDYSDEYLTDEMLIDYIDSAWPEVYEFRADSDSDFDVTEHTASLSAGSKTVDLPEDFYSLMAVDIADAGTTNFRRVRKNNWLERNSYQNDQASGGGYRQSAADVGYRLMGSEVRIEPPPNSNRTVRLTYKPQPTTLSSSLQSLSFHGALDLELLCTHVIRRVKDMEEEPLDTSDREIARLEKRLVRAFRKRDDAEAERLADPDME